MFLKPANYVEQAHYKEKVRSKAIPVSGLGGPQSCEMSRIPYFLHNYLIDGSGVVSLIYWLHVTPPGKFLVLISVKGRVNPKYHSAAGN
jgi:hypothetical protein